jgi:phosphatidylserine/phosphatidylglycerophosphate/cardiolipin synthase-like enzyme
MGGIDMKRVGLLILGTVLAAIGQSQPQFELVESIPIETTLDNPDIRNTQEVWLEMISAAKKSLDIEQFYVANQAGEPLEDIIQAIETAAKRGVAVRLIADKRFQKTYPETIERLGRQNNISVRIIDFGTLAGGVQHAKFFIVDNETIFLGSQNFDWRALKHIHELGLRIKHTEAVRFYQDIFNLDWNLAETNDRTLLEKFITHNAYRRDVVLIERNDTLTFTPTASPIGFIPDSALWDEPNIIRLIDGAKSEITLQFLGYSTLARDKSLYTTLDDALRGAANRGVKVRLLVSDWEKGTPAEKSLKELSQIPNIEVKFSVIPEWSGGYIPYARVEHCKFLVVDRTSFWLGTSNAEKSYFYNARNVGVVGCSTSLAKRLRDVFMKSWESLYTELVRADVKYEKREHGERQK